MRETVFLQQNKEKWQQLEEQMNNPQASADELADLYIQVTDDLAYARTFFPETKSLQYLNSLAVKIHSKVYRNRKERSNRMITFWTHEIPEVMYRHRYKMLFSLVVFLLATAIGVLSAAKDERFVRLILGDDYVEMTLDNIKQGRPMDVYGRSEQTDMFFYIAFNNIRVSFYQFMTGVSACVMTLVNEMQNAIMLGAFQYFFYERNLLQTSMLAIWIHGTLEISAIIIACGAGFILGSGFLFPGTYKRTTSMVRGAKDGIKIIVVLVPVFIVAAFFESYVTRYYQSLGWYSLIFILPSLAGIVWYFVYYPFKLYHGKKHA